MAAVTEGADRAQLILIGALALAVSLVGIALVLNSAIYTHNLASRYQSPADAPVTLDRDVRAGAGGLMDEANAEQSTYIGIRNDYTSDLPEFEAAIGRVAAPTDRSLSLEHVLGSAVRGVRVTDDSSGTFVSRQGDIKWYVARNVRVRQVVVTVGSPSGLTSQTSSTTDSHLSGGPSGDEFVIEFDDGAGTTRYVAVYDDGGPTIMVHDGSSSLGTCSAGSTPVKLDVTGERFGGSSCPALSALDDLSLTYDVRYHGGDHIEGTYHLTADLEVDDGSATANSIFTDNVDTANYGDQCTQQTYYPTGSPNAPRVSTAWYSSRLRVVQSTTELTYEGGQRVAPDEPGDRTLPPLVTYYNVDEADGTADTGEWTVSWFAADPDGTVDATLEITEPDGQVRTFTSATSGDLFSVDGESGAYRFELTVEDGDGNQRTVVQVHDDDTDESGCPP